MLSEIPQVKSLTKQAFEEIVPQWHFPGGQRGHDNVDCDCNGVLMKYGPDKKPLYQMSRAGQPTWHVMDSKGQPDLNLPWLGLGASLHWGCHNVSLNLSV